MLKFHFSMINFLIFFLFMTLMLSLLNLFILMFLPQILFMEINLINIYNTSINFVLMIDLVSTLFILCVSIISLAVFKFSQLYMENDKNFIRFHLLLMIFVLSMEFLILSPNLISALLGWDGLGLSSYLLVIYYSSPKAYNSGMITALTNRVGDALILISIAWLFMFGNWNFLFYMNKEFFSFLLFFLMVAACTKSAQIPFSAWLPAAMAAPTPVSSLVHSSTLVTAGIYLLIRHNELFFINEVSEYLMLVGSLTMIMASISALLETDMKKMVALSTLSQLGVMMLSLGLGAFTASFFHLLSHAFFKALLFLCVGAMIHSMKDYQDLRIAGSSIFTLPVINSFLLVSVFSLTGIPFMSAFFSKEIILELIMMNNFNLWLYLMMILGIFLTAAYSIRLIAFMFMKFFSNDLITFKSEENKLIMKSMYFLLIPSALSGVWINFYMWESVKLTSSTMILKSTILSLLVFGMIYGLIVNLIILKLKWSLKNWILSSMWILPFISTQFPLISSIFLSTKISKIFDRGALNIKMNYFFQISEVLSKLTFTFKMMFKILISIFIWGMVFNFYYLCNANKM